MGGEKVVRGGVSLGGAGGGAPAQLVRVEGYVWLGGSMVESVPPSARPAA